LKLVVEDLWVRLGGLEVLRGVSMVVESGETVVVVGRNGAGKTTLLRTIMGVVKPYRGRAVVSVDGASYEVTRMKPYQVAALGVGYVPQGRMVFPDLTVEENLEVAYGGPVPDDVLDWIYTVFPELRRLSRRLGRYLSGGEQQMLAVARALVRRPKLLLLDEPLEGLAPRAAASLLRGLAEIKEQGVTMVITEPGNVRRVQGLADRVYGIDRGEVVYSGSVEGLLSSPEARRRIWGF
jgi:branched-chain amino acid transport system ATP-binding protein